MDAIEKYREVLRSVEEHKEQLHTDSLQQLHAMYNLKEILSSKPEGVDPTLRDDQLSTQVFARFLERKIVNVFLSIGLNMCFRCSKEPSQ